jgi:hypothetical protein
MLEDQQERKLDTREGVKLSICELAGTEHMQIQMHDAQPDTYMNVGVSFTFHQLEAFYNVLGKRIETLKRKRNRQNSSRTHSSGDGFACKKTA